ncbi:LytTr DNA-binding domain family protein [Pseudovibrio sp. JE062]|nr:LytTr DNA-binding domain family protein [Pseudovibrio sp. JE062]
MRLLCKLWECSLSVEKTESKPFTFQSRRDMRGFSFFVVIPLALAAFTATETGYNRTLGYSGAIIYISFIALVSWWIAELTTKLVWVSARAYRPPLWVICSVGVTLACVLVVPLVSQVSYLFAEYWPTERDSELLNHAATNPVSEELMQTARAVIFWLTSNYAFDRLLNYPRFRYETQDLPQQNSSIDYIKSENELLRRLQSISSLDEIDHVKAEEHYTCVSGKGQHELIHYRFGLALKDLAGEEGFKVHRSHWVRKSAVFKTVETGSKLHIELKNGTLVPVSRPNHSLIRQVL